MRRRELLAGGGTALVAALAGCANALSGGEPPESGETQYRDRELPTQPREVAGTFSIALLEDDREMVAELLHEASPHTAAVAEEYAVETELDFDIPGVEVVSESDRETVCVVELHSADIEEWEHQFRLRPDGGDGPWRVYTIEEPGTATG
ncbi:MAG: hypothetical protein V5A55_05205 [Halovenus sp.]